MPNRVGRRTATTGAKRNRRIADALPVVPAANAPAIDDLVDRVYDIAVSPERMERLVDGWMKRVECVRDGDVAAHDLFVSPPMVTHVQRAERVLREMIALVGETRNGARDWAQGIRAAAIVVNRAGVVLAANPAALATLGLVPGNTVGAMAMAADDLALLMELIGQPGADQESGASLLRLRMSGGNAPMLVRLVEAVGGDPDQVGLVSTMLAWPENLSRQLVATFKLTQAECSVLKELALGATVREVADRSGRGEATVRSHVKSLLEKTEARSQMEMVRLVLGLMDVAEQGPLIAPLTGPPGISPQRNDYSTHMLADDRRLDYLSIGDPGGRPFVMLPTDMGFTRLPPAAERWLADNRMRMIVPVRAGYGHSSPLPNPRDAFATHVRDLCALCEHLRIDRAPILAFCDDFRLAVDAANAEPHRISAIVAVGPIMPANEPRHFRRMTKWARFIYANARYAPRALPFVAMVFFQCARRLGPKRFVQLVVASSKADLAVLDDDETLTSMLQGTEIAIGPRFTAHVAWAAGAAANFGVDWSGALAQCRTPMILYAGHQDPFAPFATTKEFAETHGGIDLHEFPQYGQFLYPVWPQFLGEIRKHLSN